MKATIRHPRPPPFRPLLAGALALLVVTPGCVSDDSWSDHFAEGLGGWTATGGNWSVQARPGGGTANAEGATDGATDRHFLRGTGDVDSRVHFLASGAGVRSDVQVSVSFALVAGQHPEGAGVTVRWQDRTHFAIVRYSISEGDWHLFVADGGEARKVQEATLAGHGVHPRTGEWVRLEVRVQGGHVEAFAAGRKVINADLGEGLAQDGHAGLFLRGNTVALFEDFRIA